MVLTGNITGSIKSAALPNSGVLTAITVYNNSGSASVVRIGVTISGVDTFLFSFNLAVSGSAGSSSYLETKINLTTGSKVVIVASQQTYYSFTINPQ